MKDNQPLAYFREDVATLGDRITAAREAQGMSQTAFARRLGVKLKTVQNWEEDRTEPRANRAQMLAGLLGVSLSWLLTGEGDDIPEPAADGTPLPDEVGDILDELRQLRLDMSQSAQQLGHIEKRLRAVQR
ncbi:helix-turn-helix domain-containing protein [Sulfitobacter sp. JB4-11]|uniref:helix-turn-helix domain-containing protein n=1 Tax=Sulfitobacter rhodophyticola TaxID=3238304 RepID=UPI003518316E